MRAYGIEFKEGPDGFGVYASKDVQPTRRPRVRLYPAAIFQAYLGLFNQWKIQAEIRSSKMNDVFICCAQVIMEIPLELMVTISKKLPWMFFPDIVPIGHPIFDIINSTNPEVY